MYALAAKEGQPQTVVVMSELTKFNADADEKENSDFYLPATAVSPNFDRVGNVIGSLFGPHEVVLIPETYDE